jgi:hypothetical protein
MNLRGTSPAAVRRLETRLQNHVDGIFFTLLPVLMHAARRQVV